MEDGEEDEEEDEEESEEEDDEDEEDQEPVEPPQRASPKQGGDSLASRLVEVLIMLLLTALISCILTLWAVHNHNNPSSPMPLSTLATHKGLTAVLTHIGYAPPK